MTVVVEGEFDQQVLFAVCQAAGLPVVIEAVTGNSNVRPVRLLLEKRGPGPAVAVLDRDFGPLQAALVSWDDPDSRVVVWPRHEIENYLLDPPVVAQVLAGLAAAAITSTNVDYEPAPPTDARGARGLLVELAQRQTPNHAWHVTRAALWDEILMAAGRPKGTRWQPTEPALTAGPDNCIDSLLAEAERFRAVTAIVSALPALLPAAVRERYNVCLQTFTTEEYWRGDSFLVDFQGKELLEQFCDELWRRRRLRRTETEEGRTTEERHSQAVVSDLIQAAAVAATAQPSTLPDLPDLVAHVRRLGA